MEFDKERPIPPGPKLALLMVQGKARIETNGDVLLRAADGTEVSIGALWTAKDFVAIEAYLEAHPTPETW